MNEVIKLLETKNYWFVKFLQLCEKSLVLLESDSNKFVDDELEAFDTNRASLLNIIRRTDEKIQFLLENTQLKNRAPNSEEKTKINFHLREKDSIIKQILELDAKIIAALEKAKEESAAKLKSIDKSKRALKNYKSQQAGDKQVDRQV
jgi:hypothetical protein